MPAADFTIRQGDYGEVLRDTLRDIYGDPVDLEHATVTLRVAPIGGGTAILDDVEVDNDQVSDGSDGSLGMVSYLWLQGDSDSPGVYLAQWTATVMAEDTVVDVLSFPPGGYRRVLILPEA